MRLLYLLLLLPSTIFAQTLDRTAQQAAFQLAITRTSDDIRVDGDLSENTWQTAAVTSEFWLKWPRDGAPAPEQTEVRCAYDDRYLYIAVTAHDTTPNYVIQSLKRDIGYWDSDGFAVVLDPSNAAVNGYFLAPLPMGYRPKPCWPPAMRKRTAIGTIPGS